ncbi:MAG TPA: DUF4255 domain-containing protein [Anaerolineaceae bacterium]|nr:DUF4255 domain-containing protein [Anaerolineaceae bacterium]HPN52385.1 DUF4255 domain-containing protein [Anaerolineaceae bacterium]
MIEDLDDAIRQLLIREIPISHNEVDISFNQPKREWSARLSRPTLNVFFYDIRENLRLRGSQQWLITRHNDGTVTQKRNPVRVDIHYLVTAWASDSDDEHSLLSRTLLALFRLPYLPPDLLTRSLQGQPTPVPIQVAQPETLTNPSDLWNALDNEVRPGIVLTITITMDPYAPLVGPMVRTLELRVGQAVFPAHQQELLAEAGENAYWTIGGTIHTDLPSDQLELFVLETGKEVTLQKDGRFTIGKLRAGAYTLEARLNQKPLKSIPLAVPSPDYDLTL